MQSEATIQRAFIRAVKKAGGLPTKVKGPRGWLDYDVRWPHRYPELVELKRPGGRLRKSQVRMHAKLRKYKGDLFTVTTLEEIAAYIEGAR